MIERLLLEITSYNNITNNNGNFNNNNFDDNNDQNNSTNEDFHSNFNHELGIYNDNQFIINIDNILRNICILDPVLFERKIRDFIGVYMIERKKHENNFECNVEENVVIESGGSSSSGTISNSSINGSISSNDNGDNDSANNNTNNNIDNYENNNKVDNTKTARNLQYFDNDFHIEIMRILSGLLDHSDIIITLKNSKNRKKITIKNNKNNNMV